MKSIIRLLPVATILFMGMLSCDEKDSLKEEKQSGPKIETISADKGTFTVASLSGRVSGLEGVTLDFECGIEYSTDESFRDEYSIRQKIDKKYTEDSYSITVYGIQPGKKYYYRAYYINQKLIYYGDVKTFTFEWTTSEIEKSRGPVDLGLKVKWATYNVGATCPWDYGDYFAWGETEPYYEAGYAQVDTLAHWKNGKSDGYSWSSYKYCNGSYNTTTKYCNNSSFGNNGFTDSNTTLDPGDDVAHVVWGGSWRMPTNEEFTELLNNCTWTQTTQNGVNGYLVTSNKSGYTDSSIFLPSAGSRYGTSLYNVDSVGGYWSSSLVTDYPSEAWNLLFSSDVRSTYCYDRFIGRSVRPVCP